MAKKKAKKKQKKKREERECVCQLPPTNEELSRARGDLIRARKLAEALRSIATQSLERGFCVLCKDELTEEKRKKYDAVKRVTEKDYWNYSDALLKIPKTIFED